MGYVHSSIQYGRPRVIISGRVIGLFTTVALFLVSAGCATHDNTLGMSMTTVPIQITTSSTTISYQGAVVPARPGEPANQVWVDNYGVYPNVLTVTAGTIVTWANIEGGGEYLSVISDDGLFDGYIIASPMGFGVPGPQNFSYLFVYPGTYGYSIDPLNATDCGIVVVK